MWLLSLVGAFPNGARYALFFGVWAGLMEAIPYLGPVLAAVPPTLVAVFDSPLAALWVIIAFVLIQEVEGHILVPVIMGSRFRVHPLVVIFAILAGGEIHGITGALVAIPLIPLFKETYAFLRPRLRFERWPSDARGVVDSAIGDGHATTPERRRLTRPSAQRSQRWTSGVGVIGCHRWSPGGGDGRRRQHLRHISLRLLTRSKSCIPPGADRPADRSESVSQSVNGHGGQYIRSRASGKDRGPHGRWRCLPRPPFPLTTACDTDPPLGRVPIEAVFDPRSAS